MDSMARDSLVCFLTGSLVYNVPWTMMFTDDKVSYLEWCKAKTLELVKSGKVELPLPRPPP